MNIVIAIALMMAILVPQQAYSANGSGKVDNLKSAQKTIADSLTVNQIRMRVASENMANHKTPNYKPKTVKVRTTNNRKNDTTSIKVKSIERENNKVKYVYDPGHPAADERGMIEMPKLDPLMIMMDMHQSRLDNERAIKTYKMTTDMRHKTLKMLN